MADLEGAYGAALLCKPWLAKTLGNQIYLFKYAYHQDSALFLVTTLTSVYLEILTPSRILSRASASALITQPSLDSFSTSNHRANSYGQSFGESQNRETAIRGCLDGLDGLFGNAEWDEVDVEQGEEDSFSDLVLNISSDKFAWSLKLNKLMDSESLAVIKDHLLNPLMALSGCLIDRLGDNPGYIPALQKGIDTSAATATRRLAPLLKNTLNRPLLQTSITRWNQVKRGSDDRLDIVDEYAISDTPERPAVSARRRGKSETPPPSPSRRKRDSTPMDLELRSAQVAAGVQVGSPTNDFRSLVDGSPSPSPSVLPEPAPEPQPEEEEEPSSDGEWNSDMTEPESDDEEAVKAFGRRRARVLRQRESARVTQSRPEESGVPDTPDQDSGYRLPMDSPAVNDARDDSAPSSPNSFQARPTGKTVVRKRRVSSPPPSPPSKRSRSGSGSSDGPARTILSQTESQKHEAAAAMRNALSRPGGTQPPQKDNNHMGGLGAARGRASGTVGARGRGRGRGKSVW